MTQLSTASDRTKDLTLLILKRSQLANTVSFSQLYLDDGNIARLVRKAMFRMVKRVVNEEREAKGSLSLSSGLIPCAKENVYNL